MIYKAVIALGICVVASWPVLYARYEWYWFGLPLGVGIALGGVVVSGGRKGGGS